ncbi:hypothetical protein ACTQV1_08615 [Paratractidigestivibacter faecalis]|uniref:hypothetical protein n=1 Tax=Paratractidigestivibacter faecalis TaxID=2292441 RepID=UPI003F9C9382
MGRDAAPLFAALAAFLVAAAAMEHDVVVMTPREVHALAMDIKSFALELGRETCRIVEDERGHSACSRCGVDYLCMCEAEFCPSCGAEVVR